MKRFYGSALAGCLGLDSDQGLVADLDQCTGLVLFDLSLAKLMWGWEGRKEKLSDLHLFQYR